MLPLSMSSEGSAQIGGVLSTNAGGNNTLRYGNARDLVLGLEVVLSDGQIWHGLRRLHKDNTGYCLRQLFVGAEGTLGIITAAVLKLVPLPRDRAVALCALPSVPAALELLVWFRRRCHEAIQAFEYLSGEGVNLVLKHFPDTQLPFRPADHYVLVELASALADSGLQGQLEDVCGQAMDAGLVLDAAFAGGSAQRAALWKLREEQADAHMREGPAVLNDVSVPISKVPEFILDTHVECERRFPGIRVITFGHVGDGNVHYTLLPPPGADSAPFLEQAQEIMGAVNDVVRRFDGSFSAEHGIGRLKSYLLEDWRGGPELDTMRRIKKALDPLNLLNPGKVLEPEGL
jgi:FAD/FMN-containing dehydrogenase